MSKPLTAKDLAEALACFNNAALSHMHTAGSPASQFDVVAAIVSGVNAVAWRLEEIDKEHARKQQHAENVKRAMGYPFLSLPRAEHHAWLARATGEDADPEVVAQAMLDFTQEYMRQQAELSMPAGTVSGRWTSDDAAGKPRAVKRSPKPYYLFSHSDYASIELAEKQAKRIQAVHWIVRRSEANPRVFALYQLVEYPAMNGQVPFWLSDEERDALQDRAHKKLVQEVIDSGE